MGGKFSPDEGPKMGRKIERAWKDRAGLSKPRACFSVWADDGSMQDALIAHPPEFTKTVCRDRLLELYSQTRTG